MLWLLSTPLLNCKHTCSSTFLRKW